MSDCATPTLRFETPTPLALEAAFDGGRISSDGGLLWLARVDSEMGSCEAIPEHVFTEVRQEVPKLLRWELPHPLQRR